MSRRSLAGALALVALLMLTLGAGTAVLLRYEPRYHSKAQVDAGGPREQQSKEFLSECSELFEAVKNEQSWSQSFSFTDQQINSFLAETFVPKGPSEKLLPEGISEPRVSFEPDVMRLSFRYRAGMLNTVVSVALRAWVAPSEGNVLALRIEGLHAGAVPFKAQWLLERISEAGRQHDVDVSWYRHEGHPVAVLRFQANQARPTIKLRGVRIEQGKMTVHGESAGPTRTAMNAAVDADVR